MPGLIASLAQIWVAVAPVDMRRGLDGLTAIVQHSLGHSPGAEVEQLQDASPCTPVARPKCPHAGRQLLPSHLPRIEHRHEPESCTCGHCGPELVKIGKEVTEQLDVEPAKFFVHRHICPQYAYRSCETVTVAPIPPAVIDDGLAAVGLLSR